jgi:hypothetical protein
MSSTGSYKARQFNLSGLNGSQIKHWRCTSNSTEGYVKETNNLTERITEFIKTEMSIRKRCRLTPS